MTREKTGARRRKNREWTTSEVATLKEYRMMGATWLAAFLGRTVGSVKAKARELKVSLRRAGVRCGLILGQPRDMHLSAEVKTANVRDLVFSGRISMETLMERISLDGQGMLTLCPHCSKRPVTVRSTGLCAPCHKELLIDALNDELATYEAQKQQWKAQQRVSRARRAAGAQ